MSYRTKIHNPPPQPSLFFHPINFQNRQNLAPHFHGIKSRPSRTQLPNKTKTLSLCVRGMQPTAAPAILPPPFSTLVFKTRPPCRCCHHFSLSPFPSPAAPRARALRKSRALSFQERIKVPIHHASAFPASCG